MPAAGAAYVEIAQVFLRLGLTSFGGPVAHLGYFHEEIVRRRRWLEEKDYADLVALCQFLPGPASSQVVFALGRHRAGLLGACLASLCFTLPSALLMIGFGYGAMRLGDVSHARWLQGLKLAAVAVVAQAVWTMGRRLCPDWPRRGLALAATATFDALLTYIGFTLALSSALTLAGVFVLRARAPEMPRPYRAWGHPWTTGVAIALSVWMTVHTLWQRPIAALVGLTTIVIGLWLYVALSGRSEIGGRVARAA